MSYLFLIIACFSGICKVVAMKSCGRVCPGEYNSVRINTLRACICGLVSAVIFFASGAQAEGQYWWICLLSGISNAVMMFVWILCTQRISLIFVETFCLIGSTAIPLLLAPLLYEGETVSPLQWCGVACLLGAVLALSARPRTAREKEGAGEEAPLEDAAPAHRAAILTGVYVLLLVLSALGLSLSQKLYPTYAGEAYTPWFNLMTFAIVLACFAVVLLGGRIFRGKAFMPESVASGKKLLLFVSIAAVMIYVHQYFSTLAAGMLSSAIFYPLSRGINMLLTVVCDVTIFHQKLTRNTCIGLLFIFASIILTNL